MNLSEERRMELINKSEKLPDYESSFVVSVLELYLRLQKSYSKLTSKDRELEEKLVFSGFNKKKEEEYFLFAKLLLEEEEFKDLDYRQMDSDLASLNIYSSLLKKEEDVNISCRDEEGGDSLSLVEINYILDY